MSATAERFRREGQADAVVLLVARRFAPHLCLEDFARALELTQPEVRAAIGRYRERVRNDRAALVPPPTKPNLRVVGSRGGRPAMCERNEEIRSRVANGETVRAIAAELGLSYQRVHQIAHTRPRAS